MAEEPKLLGYSMEQMQRFGEEYIKHNILFVKVNNNHRRECNVRYMAVRNLAQTMGIAADSLNFTQQVLQECANYRVRFCNLLMFLVQKVQKCWQPGEVALELAPAWVRRVERRLGCLPDAMAALGLAEGSGGGAGGPAWGAAGGAWGPEAARAQQLVAALVGSSAARRSLQPPPWPEGALRRLLPPAALRDVDAQLDALRSVWERVRAVCVCKLQALVRVGDEPRLLTTEAPSALEWRVIDLELLYGDVSLVTSDSFELDPERRVLMALVQLAARHRVESPAPRREMALRWVRLRREFCAGGASMSGVGLQRRWHQLKEATREVLLGCWRAHEEGGWAPQQAPQQAPRQAPGAGPVHVALAQRFPYVVTSPLPPWERVRPLLPEELAQAETALVCDTAPAAPQADDDLVLVEKVVETIEVPDDEPDEPRPPPALRPGPPPPGEVAAPARPASYLELNDLDPAKVQAIVQFESDSSEAESADNDRTDSELGDVGRAGPSAASEGPPAGGRSERGSGHGRKRPGGLLGDDSKRGRYSERPSRVSILFDGESDSSGDSSGSEWNGAEAGGGSGRRGAGGRGAAQAGGHFDEKLLMDVSVVVRREDQAAYWRYVRDDTGAPPYSPPGDPHPLLQSQFIPHLSGSPPSLTEAPISEDTSGLVKVEAHQLASRGASRGASWGARGGRRSAGARVLGLAATPRGLGPPPGPADSAPGSRAKRVALVTIDEVRRINGSLLTAQVAPLAVAEGAAAAHEGGPSGEQLARLLQRLGASPREPGPRGARYCCLARRLRAHHDMRLRLALGGGRRPPLPPAHELEHKGRKCYCCCVRLLPADSALQLRAQQRQLYKDIRALLQRHRRAPRPPRGPRPPREPRPAAQDYDEWQRQKNATKQFFELRPATRPDPVTPSDTLVPAAPLGPRSPRSPEPAAPPSASVGAPTDLSSDSENDLSIVLDESPPSTPELKAPLAPRGRVATLSAVSADGPMTSAVQPASRPPWLGPPAASRSLPRPLELVSAEGPAAPAVPRGLLRPPERVSAEGPAAPAVFRGLLRPPELVSAEGPAASAESRSLFRPPELVSAEGPAAPAVSRSLLRPPELVATEGPAAPAVSKGLLRPPERVSAEGPAAPAVFRGLLRPPELVSAEGPAAPAVSRSLLRPPELVPAEGPAAPAVSRSLLRPPELVSAEGPAAPAASRSVPRPPGPELVSAEGPAAPSSSEGAMPSIVISLDDAANAVRVSIEGGSAAPAEAPAEAPIEAPASVPASGSLVIAAGVMTHDELIQIWENSQVQGEVHAVLRVDKASALSTLAGHVLLADGVHPCERPRYLVCVGGRVRRLGGSGRGGAPPLVSAGGQLYRRVRAVPPVYARLLTALTLPRTRQALRQGQAVFVLSPASGSLLALQDAPPAVRAMLQAAGDPPVDPPAGPPPPVDPPEGPPPPAAASRRPRDPRPPGCAAVGSNAYNT